MDLWTEFEGATIDSAYSLKRLLQTEGRSAFFSTLNANGDAVLIRIIECHFDEDEILARWRGVEMLRHPAFLRIDRFGQFLIEEDQITAVYAVFERVDENLAHVLERGRLSPAEAADIGRSVASALATLHANGFVHEHVEARNIYAVGETVKMRSDCIRETPEGEAGLEARRRDVRDLAVLLRQVLKGMAGASTNGHALPAPFDEIVRNGASGRWGLAEIQAALAPNPATRQARKAAQAAVKDVAAPAGTGMASEVSAEATPSAGAAPTIAQVAAAGAINPEMHEQRTKHLPDPAADDIPLPGRRRASLEIPVVFGISQQDMRRWMTAAGLLLVVILFGWIAISYWSGAGAHASAQPPAAQPETAATQRLDPTPATPLPSQSPAAAPASSSTSSSGARWRVVAFTFNHKEQAQKKVQTLAHKYPSLWPDVFSPTGKAPWLVTVGGALDRDAAYTLAHKARTLGLPRDTYAQNYNPR